MEEEVPQLGPGTGRGLMKSRAACWEVVDSQLGPVLISEGLIGLSKVMDSAKQMLPVFCVCRVALLLFCEVMMELEVADPSQ